MTYPDPITLDLDASGYVTSLGQADTATTQFGSNITAVAVAMNPLRQALSHLTPTKAMLAGYVGLGAVAGRTQQQLATLHATAKTTGASFDTLAKGTRQLARDLPIGNDQARELVTTITRLGVATKGSENTVIGLSKTFVKLSGATGEGPAVLAQGMLQLTRATNAGTNVDRITKLADSLTTVSAKSGASASGVLSFSKAIAPMAQASGIGTTKIMGISAAFTKMGEDGYGAANAFNKMLGDLNRSVREGSPEMNKYAEIVGKSASEFERMFKADPTEAITQVTEALGKAPNAPRLLESLGLEGVRNQRYLQELSQSGGLRSAVSDAVSGYGSGSTTQAADKAFHGLIDSTTRLSTVSQQAADAMGTPFLGALTTFTNALGAGVSGFAHIAGSGPVQKGLEVGSPLLLAGLAAFKLIPSLVTGLGLVQGATSGPLRGFLGGYAGTGAGGSALAARMGGAAYNERLATGLPMGNRFMAPWNERMARYGAALGGFVGSSEDGGPNLLRKVYGGAGMGAGMYLRSLSETARLARVPFAEREMSMRPISAAADNYMMQRSMGRAMVSDAKASVGTPGGLTQSQYKDVQNFYKNSMRDLRTETLGAARPVSILARGVAELGKQVTLSAPAIGARGVAAAGRGLASVGGALMGGLGGPVGLGLTAFMIGSQIKSKADEETARRADAARNATTFIDDYRVAMGKATQATSTFAGQMDAANKAQLSAPMSLQQVQEVARTSGAHSKVESYSGSPASARRRIQGQTAGTPLATDEIQRIQQDLFLSGYTIDQVGQITSGLGGSTGKSNSSLTDSQVGNVAGQTRDIAAMQGKHGLKGFINHFDVIGGINRAWDGGATTATIDVLSKPAEKRANELVAQIVDRAGKRSDAYSPEYGRSESLKEIDASVKAAFKSGNFDLAEQIQRAYQQQPGTGVSDANQGRLISEKEINQKFGGSYTAALAHLDANYKTATYDPVVAARAAGTASPTMNPGWVAKTLAGNPLAALFSATGTGAANTAVQALTGPNGQPESASAQFTALQTSLVSQRNAGTSMQELSRYATQAANTLGQLDDATIAFLGELRQAAQFQSQAKAPYQSSTSTLMTRAAFAADDAKIKPNTPQAKAIQRQGVTDLMDIRDQLLGQAKAMVEQRREVQVTEKRQQADYIRQGVQMEQDYVTARERQEEQYGTAVLRTKQANHRAIVRAENDFIRGRIIANRDFNKQLARQAEDGARAMYDPYSRIAVQQTWDAPNMLGNLTEQNQAIEEQLNNLSKLRSMHGGSNLIKLLGLNDSKNAQQLASLVGDAASDPKVLDALNKAADKRQKLGGKLVADPDNVGRTRSIEDFHTQMADQAKQYEIQMARGREDYNTTISQMAEDEARAMKWSAEDRIRQVARFEQAQATAVERMHADVKRADEEIVMTLAGYSKTLNDMIHGQTVDFKGKTESTLKDTLLAVKQFQGGLEKIIIDMGPGIELDINGNQKPGPWASGYAMPSDSSAVPVTVHGPKTPTPTPGPPPVIGPRVTGVKTGQTPDPQPNHSFYPATAMGPVPKHALGGIALAPHIGMVAEAGVPEALIPLNQRGADVLAEAMRRFVTADQGRQLQAAQAATQITYAGTTVHNTDYSQTFEHVTVMSQDPDDMAKKMQAKQRRSNLTRPPQGKR